MKYSYQSKDKTGEAHDGEIDSSDIHTAAVLLRKKGLIIISIKPKQEASSKFLDKFINRVSFTQLVTITRQLATMISSGLNLSESIDILTEQQDSKKLKLVLEEVSHDIKGGLTLAQSLGKHPDVFPLLYVNLIKSGEASGKLDDVLLRMADNLEKQQEFRSKVQGAMIYPALVISMMVIVTLIMMVFVIPKLTSLYKDASLDLPLPTVILITISDAFVNYWWVMIIIAVAGVLGVRRWVATPEGSMALDSLVLKVPIAGKIISNVTITNFTRTMGLLLSAGIPLLEAISIVEDITENNVFKNALRSAHSGVERGLQISSILVGFPIFPRIVGQMVKVGEETGKTDEVFFKLSDYFESESDNLIKNLTVAIEPIVLIILGIGVAFLVISVILPIYKLTTSF